MITNQETTITRIVQDTPDTKTFYVDYKTTEFLPGQFYMLGANIEEKELKRAYSIATSPTEKELAFTIKITPEGKFSTHSFYNFKKGDKIKISGPYGKFHYKGEQQPLILIGAGSGIAPLRSIAKYAIDKKLNNPIKLFFSNKKQQDIIYHKEFENWKKENKNFHAYYTLTSDTWEGPMGRISKELLEIEQLPNALYYLCGPPEFVRTLEAFLKELDVPETNIHTEKYN